MKKSMVALLAGISMVALLAAGCANKEAIKKEEAVVPVTSSAQAEAARAAEEAKAVEDANGRASEIQPAQDYATESGSQASLEAMLETVYFDFDKADLRQDTRDVLSKNAETILKTLPGAKVQIAGHTDERGSAEYNLALGERRAKSALKYLTTLGVKDEALSIISYGEEKPAIEGSDESAWAKNRRAEFAITK